MSDESSRMQYETIIRKLHGNCSRGGDPNGYADADYYDMHSEDVMPVIKALKESLNLNSYQRYERNEFVLWSNKLNGIKTEVEMNLFIRELYSFINE